MSPLIEKALKILLSNGVGNSLQERPPILTDSEWCELFGLSEKLGVCAIALDGYHHLLAGGLLEVPTDETLEYRKLAWYGQSMHLELEVSKQREWIDELVLFFEENGLQVLGLKGPTIAQWYPNPLHRSSSDLDVFLLNAKGDGSSLSAFERGNKMVESQGGIVDRHIYLHSVFKYKGLTVENHQHFTAVRSSKRQAEFDRLLLHLVRTQPMKPVDGLKLWCGSPMFNALFLTYHAQKHLLTEHISLKMVLDWGVFLSHNSFDWNQFIAYCEQFGMKRFAESMTRLAVQVCGCAAPHHLKEDAVADRLLWKWVMDIPTKDDHLEPSGILVRRFSQMVEMVKGREKYKVFYDRNVFWCISRQIIGHFFD